MPRLFYTDDEETYATPGLPAIPQQESPATPVSPSPPASASPSQVIETVNGNLIITSPSLQRFVSNARTQAIDYYTAASERIERFTSTGHAHSLMTIDRIASFKADDEQILPHACTVLTASLMGAIFARGRLLPVRFASPLIFGGLALNYTMPHTFDNIANSIKDVALNLEDKYVPSFKQVREDAVAKTAEMQVEIDNLQKQAWNSLVGNVSTARESVNAALSSIKKD